MVRDDVGGQEAADRIFEVLRTCAGHLPPGSCNDFLYPDGHPRLESVKRAETAKTRGSRKVCTKFTEALFRTTRQDFGLGASDRPYSKERPSDWFPRATEKMVQQLDIIYERAQHQGLDLSFLLADLSQQVSRGAWRDDGYVPTLTTASLLYSYSHHRALLGEECLKLNGFPVDELNLDAHTQQDLRALAHVRALGTSRMRVGVRTNGREGEPAGLQARGRAHAVACAGESSVDSCTCR